MRRGMVGLAVAAGIVWAIQPTAGAREAAAESVEKRVVEVAKRFLAAVRGGDVKTLEQWAVENDRWPAARWARMAEKIRKQYAGDPERLATVREALADGDSAAIRLDGPPGRADRFLCLVLQRTPARWRVCSMNIEPISLTLRNRLDWHLRGLQLKKAREAEKAGDVAGATTIYKELAEERSSDRLQYAYFLQKHGKFDQALNEFKAYYADQPQAHHVLRAIAHLYTKTGRHREAIAAWESFAAKAPEYSDARYDLLQVWQKAGGLAAARERYLAMAKDAKAERKRIVLAHLLLGDMALKAKDDDGAKKHYGLVMAKTAPPREKWQQTIRRVLLESFISQGWLDEALAECRKHPVPSLLTRLGERLRRQGRGQQMLALYRGYLLSGPREGGAAGAEPLAFGYLGVERSVINTIVSLGEGPALADQLRAKIAERKPAPSVRLRLCLGCLLVRMKRREEGVREFDEAAKLMPKPSAMFQRWVADLCRDAGAADQAIAWYEKALRTEAPPEQLRRWNMTFQMAMSEADMRVTFKVQILRALGKLYTQKKQWPDAERCYRAILDLKPRWGVEDAKTALARIWKAMGKENVLVKELREQVAKEPKNARLRRDLAKALLAAGEAGGAVEQFRQAVALSPEDLEVRLDLARALAKAKQHDEAIDEYQKVLQAAVRKDRPRGKLTHVVEPRSVMRELQRLCERTGKHGRLLASYHSILSLRPEEAKWKPSEHDVWTMVDRVVRILAIKGDYSTLVDVVITRRKASPERARRLIQEHAPQLDSLDLLIARLRAVAKQDPKDHWARLILGDVLRLAGRREESLRVYAELSRDDGTERRIRELLARQYERLKLYKQAIAEHEAVLKLCKPDSEERLYLLRRAARLLLKHGSRERAAALYREALKLDPTDRESRAGLAAATDRAAPREAVPAPRTKDAEAQHARAERLAALGKHQEAIAAYKAILATRSTDVRAMVGLARAYEKAGREAEALAAFEKAYAMRKWSAVNYGTASDLERIYRRMKADDKLVRLYTDRRYYSGVRDLYRRRKQPEKFRHYLLGQLKKNPGDVHLRLYLGRSYLDTGEKVAALEVFEKLEEELITEDGRIRNKSYALQLADGLEQLGELDEALKVMAATDYENDPDGNDWSGARLMRLYAKADPFPKALEICALRLRKDRHGHRTVTIAQEIAGFAADRDGGPKLLDGFLLLIKEKIPRRTYDRFVGAVRAYRLAHPTKPAEEDPLALLTEGRVVQTPQKARNLTDFLDKLATQANTVVVQSFRRMGARLPAPKIQRKQGAAFELLAEALNGLPAALEMTQEGHWALFEKGDPNAKVIYGAGGGAICVLRGLRSRPGDRRLSAHGKVMFEAAVQRHVLAVAQRLEVLEAVDDRGGKVPIEARQAKPRWMRSGSVSFSLGNPDPAATKIAKLRVQVMVALCTRWTRLTAERLDHTRPITLEKEGVKIQIDPSRVAERHGRKYRELPIVIERPAVPGAEGIPFLRDEVFLVRRDTGKPIRPTWRSASGGGSRRSKGTVSAMLEAFDPAATSMVVREPAAVEVVPLVLTFRDIPLTGK